MTCLYDLLLRLASTACLYVLILPLWPASTVCLHHVIAIIIIIIVHLLFKRNIYFSLLCDLCVFSSLFPEIIFLFLLLSMQLKNVMLICC